MVKCVEGGRDQIQGNNNDNFIHESLFTDSHRLHFEQQSTEISECMPFNCSKDHFHLLLLLVVLSFFLLQFKLMNPFYAKNSSPFFPWPAPWTTSTNKQIFLHVLFLPNSLLLFNLNIIGPNSVPCSNQLGHIWMRRFRSFVPLLYASTKVGIKDRSFIQHVLLLLHCRPLFLCVNMILSWWTI